MPGPTPDFNTVTVSGKYVDLSGDVIAGSVTFTAPSVLTDGDALTVIIPETLTATLDNNGEFSIDLPATDDPDITPSGWTYAVVENFPGGRSYEISVPVSAIGTGLNLATVAPEAEASGGDTAFVLLAAHNALEARVDTLEASGSAVAEVIGVALSDETTAITTGTAKATIRMPYAMTLTSVRATLTVASSSGNPTVDVNENGASVLSTKLTIDSGEKTSTTAATPAVISDATLADDAEITFDIDVAGTGAKGLKVWLIGTRA